MKKLTKRIGLVVLVLLLGLLAALLIGRSLFRGTPKFYRQYTWDGARRSTLNQQAANKILRTRQLAQQAHFGEVRAERNTNRAATGPATRPAAFSVSFSEEELNAFLFHNAETFSHLKQSYERYISEPGIFLEGGRLILAARSKDVGSVVSVQFEPSMTDEGQLRLRKVGAYGGKLPLPDAFVRPYIDKLKGWIASRTPAWRQEAKLDRNGAFNSGAVALAMGKLLINALDDRPSDPVLFMPVDEGESSTPLRITQVSVKDRTLTLALEPMTRVEREGVYARLKSDAGADQATASGGAGPQ